MYDRPPGRQCVLRPANTTTVPESSTRVVQAGYVNAYASWTWRNVLQSFRATVRGLRARPTVSVEHRTHYPQYFGYPALAHFALLIMVLLLQGSMLSR